jgi:Na+-translocating ferredoxin:NAD+ oxidoreductase RnfA subunit
VAGWPRICTISFYPVWHAFDIQRMDSSPSSYLVNDYLSICQKKWGVYIASVPSRCIVSGLVLTRPSQRHTFLDVFPHIFGFSMACDLVTIAVLRLLFTAISSAVSVGQIAFIISVLFSIAKSLKKLIH